MASKIILPIQWSFNMRLLTSVLFCVALSIPAVFAESAGELREKGIQALKDAQNNPGAIVDAARYFAKASKLYTDGENEERAVEMNSFLYWCKKKMTMENIESFTKGNETAVSNKLADIENIAPKANEAQIWFDRAEKFEHANPTEHLLVSIRFYEVAERFVGTPISLAAQKKSLEYQQRSLGAGVVEKKVTVDDALVKIKVFKLQNGKSIKAVRVSKINQMWMLTTTDGSRTAVSDTDVASQSEATVKNSELSELVRTQLKERAKADSDKKANETAVAKATAEFPERCAEIRAPLEPLYKESKVSHKKYDDAVADANDGWRAKDPIVRKKYTSQVYDNNSKAYVSQFDETGYNAEFAEYKLARTPAIRDAERRMQSADEKINIEREAILSKYELKSKDSEADKAFYLRLRASL